MPRWWRDFVCRIWPAKCAAPPEPPADVELAQRMRAVAEQERRYTHQRWSMIERLAGNGPMAPSDDELARMVAATFQPRRRGKAKGGG